jgi:hypothetical protein
VTSRPAGGQSGPTTRQGLGPPAPPDLRPRPACVTSELFDILWVTLADVIGPTATAALLQRSVKRAAARHPELRDVVIRREQFDYAYTLPASWTEPQDTARAALTQMVRELWPLLSELTGHVLVRRLHEVPMLRQCGVIPQDAEP